MIRPSGGRVGAAVLVLNLGLAAAAGAAVSVSPPSVTVAQGQTSTPIQALVSFMAFVPPAGTTGTLTIPNLPAGVTTVPASVTYTFTGGPVAQTSFRLAVSPTVRTGAYSLTVVGSGNAGTTALLLNVTLQPPPSIERLVPRTIAAGTRSARVILIGRNFAPGVQATTTSRSVQIESTRYLASTRAEAVVSVRSDAPAGPQLISAVNANGGASQQGAALIVLPAQSPAGAVSLATIVIASPLAGSAVSPSDRVYPTALLVASGAGTITGSWLVDGIPFDRFVLSANGSRPIELRARMPIPPLLDGEHSLVLALDRPQVLRSEPVTLIATRYADSALRLLAPLAGAVLPSNAPPPTFRWSLVPGAFGYEVEIEGGASRRLYQARDPEWTLDAKSYADLGPDDLHWRVRPILVGGVRGDFTPARTIARAASARGPRRGDAAPETHVLLASYSVDPPATVPPETAPVAEPAPSVETPAPAVDPYQREIAALTLQAGATGMRVSDETAALGTPPDALRLQASGQLDVGQRDGYLRATGDIAVRHDLEDEPDATAIIHENRNWVAQAGVPSDESRARGRATVGFAPPTFLDQAELLSTGVPQVGVQGTLGVPLLSASAYRSINETDAGAVSTFGLKQDVTVAAAELGRNPGRGFLRGVLVHVDDPGNEFTPAGSGDLLGVLGRLTLTPAFDVLVEAAHAKSAPTDATLGDELTGNAWRVMLSGNTGTSSYMLTLRSTDDTFVNPLNRGLTTGAIVGQWSADGTFSRMFTGGKGSLTLTGRHAVTPTFSADDAPDLSEDMGTLGLTIGSGRPASLMLGSTVSRQKADAYADLSLPATDRYQIDVNATATETVGRFSFSQTASRQAARDKIDPLLDTTTYTGSATASGSAGSYLTVTAMAMATRSQADPVVGTTDTLMFTAQPLLQIPRANIMLSGNLAYTKTKNETQLMDSTMEQYGGVAAWNPSRRSWAGALQLSLDWTRTRDSFGTDTPFVRRVGVALTLAWRMSRGIEGPLTILPAPAAQPATTAGTPGRITARLAELRAALRH